MEKSKGALARHTATAACPQEPLTSVVHTAVLLPSVLLPRSPSAQAPHTQQQSEELLCEQHYQGAVAGTLQWQCAWRGPLYFSSSLTLYHLTHFTVASPEQLLPCTTYTPRGSRRHAAATATAQVVVAVRWRGPLYFFSAVRVVMRRVIILTYIYSKRHITVASAQ